MIIKYCGPGQDDKGNLIEIKNQSWRVYKTVYQKTRKGRPVRLPRSQQVPRWKLVRVFETEPEARAFVAPPNLPIDRLGEME